MIQTILRTLLLTTSVLIASCSSSLPEEAANVSDATSDNASKPLSNINDSVNSDANAENSVDGLWDLAIEGDEAYQYWTDNRYFTIYDYQADETGTGENCYIREEVSYTREGDEFTYAEDTHNITRDANTLTIDGVSFPQVISLSVIDLNICI